MKMCVIVLFWFLHDKAILYVVDKLKFNPFWTIHRSNKKLSENSQFRSLIVLMKWKNKHIFILYGTRTFYDDEIKENIVV